MKMGLSFVLSWSLLEDMASALILP
jgi:hypothetical protein